jgi:hypothetical protein
MKLQPINVTALPALQDSILEGNKLTVARAGRATWPNLQVRARPGVYRAIITFSLQLSNPDGGQAPSGASQLGTVSGWADAFTNL